MTLQEYSIFAIPQLGHVLAKIIPLMDYLYEQSIKGMSSRLKNMNMYLLLAIAFNAQFYAICSYY